MFEYQNETVEAFEGSVNVWVSVLSVEGAVLPSCAPYVPLCFAAVFTAAVPVVVHPDNVPVSNVPLVMPPTIGAVTVRLTVVECVVLPEVPVTVIV